MASSGRRGSGTGLFGEPRRRSTRVAKSGAPYLVPAALAAVAAAALWLGWDRIANLPASVESPETQVRRALVHQNRASLEDVYGFKAGGVAELNGLRYGDVAVRVEGDRAEVLAMIEAQGRVTWRDEAASLSFIGRERFAMTPCGIALWCADGKQFARLREVLLVLFRRLDAFNGTDADAYARLVSDAYEGGKDRLVERLRRDLRGGPPARVDVAGWQIRVERDRATVGEDYAIRVGDGPERKLRARFELAREGGRWVIVSGL